MIVSYLNFIIQKCDFHCLTSIKYLIIRRLQLNIIDKLPSCQEQVESHKKEIITVMNFSLSKSFNDTLVLMITFQDNSSYAEHNNKTHSNNNYLATIKQKYSYTHENESNKIAGTNNYRT